MRNFRLSAGLAAAASCFAMPVAGAANLSTYALTPGAQCQLSIPTIDTKFRPKATGARNESTTVSNFVICPLQIPMAQNSAFSAIYLYLNTLDGMARDANCTAVLSGSIGSALYSSKTANVANSVNILSWDAGDFGGNAGDPVQVTSVTCLLPPQTAIRALESYYSYGIGT